MDPQISLVEIDKLTYFMQQAGEGFNCHVLNAMGGHFIRCYGDAEDRPDKPIELEPEAAALTDAVRPPPRH
jgi:hypothetical protein